MVKNGCSKGDFCRWYDVKNYKCNSVKNCEHKTTISDDNILEEFLEYCKECGYFLIEKGKERVVVDFDDIQNVYEYMKRRHKK